ncbi:hypothetical protein TNCV_4518301 [Trichonephila clavipes]|nr:hypothetical protein TNCV_4518301 [Trichonephila clavipes]
MAAVGFENLKCFRVPAKRIKTSKKKSPGRLHTWRNDRKATVTSVTAEFGINKSVVSHAWKAFQTPGTAVTKVDCGRPRTTTAGDD